MATITNQAALSYNGVTTLSNIAVGELVEVLTATKTAADTTYTAGGIKTFVISLVNSSAAALTGSYTFSGNTLYPLTYVTGSLLYYVNGALQATPTVTATAPLTVTGVTVPAGGSAMLIYTARVNEYAPLGVEDSITNTVTAAEMMRRGADVIVAGSALGHTADGCRRGRGHQQEHQPHHGGGERYADLYADAAKPGQHRRRRGR